MNTQATQQKHDFAIDEIVELKGCTFKVVLIDSFSGKIALKQISPQEAKYLKTLQKDKEKSV